MRCGVTFGIHSSHNFHVFFMCQFSHLTLEKTGNIHHFVWLEAFLLSWCISGRSSHRYKSIDSRKLRRGVAFIWGSEKCDSCRRWHSLWVLLLVQSNCRGVERTSVLDTAVSTTDQQFGEWWFYRVSPEGGTNKKSILPPLPSPPSLSLLSAWLALTPACARQIIYLC